MPLCAPLPISAASQLGLVVITDPPYLADPSATRDSSAAIQAALSAADAAHKPVYVPAGTYKCLSQLVAHNVQVLGAGTDKSVLDFSAAGVNPAAWIDQSYSGQGFPVCKAALTLSGDAKARVGLRDIKIVGPGSYGPTLLGTKTAGCDGLLLKLPIAVERVWIAQFDGGCVNQTSGGHVLWSSCVFTNCYYGIYNVRDYGNNYIVGSDLTGNLMASIGSPPANVFDGLYVEASHLGYSPYALYQEAGTPLGDTWMVDCTFIMTSFEQCGNGAIYAANAAAGQTNGAIRNMQIVRPGHSWNRDGSFQLPGVALPDYAVVVGAHYGGSLYVAGSNGFVAGNRGTWSFVGAAGNWDYRAGGADDVMAEPFGLTGVAYAPAGQLTIGGSGTITSGTTSVTVSAGVYCGSARSMFPSVTPTGTGGLTAFTLSVTNLVSLPQMPGPTDAARANALQGGLLVNAAAGSIGAGVVKVQMTYAVTTPSVEGVPNSTAWQVTTTGSTNQLTIPAPPLVDNASGWYAYVTQPNGSTFARQQTAGAPTAFGSNLVLSSIGTGGAAPPSGVSTQFTVSVSGGTPSSNLPFTWRVR